MKFKKLYYKGEPYKLMDEATAARVGSELRKSPRPIHIDLDGEWLKTSLIELRDDTSILIEDKRQIRDDKFRRDLNDWIDHWQHQVAKTPEEKAQAVYEFFAGFWYAHTLSRDVPPEIWVKAKKRAGLYFQKYANRVLPNPVIWKDLFPEAVQAPRAKEMRHIGELVQPRMMHHLSRAIAEDIDMSQRYS
jgi:hypothetical protein